MQSKNCSWQSHLWCCRGEGRVCSALRRNSYRPKVLFTVVSAYNILVDCPGDEVNAKREASKSMKPTILQFRFLMKFFHGVVTTFVVGLLSTLVCTAQTQQTQSPASPQVQTQEMTTTTSSDD